MIKLGVNIDHIATLRQVRGCSYPDPIFAAAIAEKAGADGITVHLREDRRHIQERDVHLLLKTVQTKLNLEMAPSQEMVDFACQLQPDDRLLVCCLVPEKRKELTTEGGLDVVGQKDRLQKVVRQLSHANIEVSLFVDPDLEQIRAAAKIQAPVVELHTGRFAESKTPKEQQKELETIWKAAAVAQELGLVVNAGHGLHYHNIHEVAAIPGLNELNIGHAIVARAVFDGLEKAVADMKRLMREAASL